MFCCVIYLLCCWILYCNATACCILFVALLYCFLHGFTSCKLFQCCMLLIVDCCTACCVDSLYCLLVDCCTACCGLLYCLLWTVVLLAVLLVALLSCLSYYCTASCTAILSVALCAVLCFSFPQRRSREETKSVLCYAHKLCQKACIAALCWFLIWILMLKVLCTVPVALL